MPRRIVIHPGFHKTGTSFTQRVLRDNRALLKPHLRSVMRPGLRPLVHAARGFSTWRDPLSLGKFARRFESFLRAIAPMPRRVLCLSAEELSGHLPGRGRLRDYGAAPRLAAEMAAAAARVFPEAEIAFFYSTRAAGPWLRSAWWEHVKSSSLTLDCREYERRYAGSADLDAIVDAVAAAQPHPVHRARLEDTATLPAGPATPLLALCDVPAEVIARLALPGQVNARPRDAAVAQALLDINRSQADPAARQTAKAAILARLEENAHE